MRSWDEGGSNRIALHIADGALIGGLGGGSIGSANGGPVGAGLAAAMADQLDEISKGVPAASGSELLGNLTANVVAGVSGALVGGGMGAATASNVELYNQSMHRQTNDMLSRVCSGLTSCSESQAMALVVLAACLSACAYVIPPAHYVDTATPTYHPAVSARIRILSSNGPERSATFWEGDCYKSGADPTATHVNDGFLASWKYSSRSVVMGMPSSPRKSMRLDGLFSKDLIREYVVPAGKPLTVSLAISIYYGRYGGTTGCAAPAVTFKPAAGQDYDVFLDTGRRACWTAVRHIDSHGLDDPVPVTRALKCQAAPVSSTEAQ